MWSLADYEQAFAAPVTLLRCAVSRFRCRSDLYEMDLLIDINVDIYPMEAWTWLPAAVNLQCSSTVWSYLSDSLCKPRLRRSTRSPCPPR